ncbi:hypothetical protein NN561_000656 [Cricetulus griseus]
MVKTGPGCSPGGHRQPRVTGQGRVPPGPGVRKVGNTSGRPPGQRLRPRQLGGGGVVGGACARRAEPEAGLLEGLLRTRTLAGVRALRLRLGPGSANPPAPDLQP